MLNGDRRCDTQTLARSRPAAAAGSGGRGSSPAGGGRPWPAPWPRRRRTRPAPRPRRRPGRPSTRARGRARAPRRHPRASRPSRGTVRRPRRRRRSRGSGSWRTTRPRTRRRVTDTNGPPAPPGDRAPPSRGMVRRFAEPFSHQPLAPSPSARRAASAVPTVGRHPPVRARARTPVTLATAKLRPLRFRSGGTPGAGRG